MIHMPEESCWVRRLSRDFRIAAHYARGVSKAYSQSVKRERAVKCLLYLRRGLRGKGHGSG